MNATNRSHSVTRRSFLKHGATAGALAAAGSALDIWEQLALAANSADTNPFAYDVSKLAKTDPALIHYSEVGRIRCPHKGPRRLTCGPDDRLYLTAGNYASILDRDGSAISEIALSTPPHCAAAAKDGTVYISLRDHIEVFDVKGQRRATWDSPGKRTWITGLAVTDNDVFAADAGNRIIWRYDRSGKIAGRIGEKNKERNVPGFIVPSPYLDVKIHRDGLLRVNNPGRHEVEAYTVNGELELAWGKPTAAIDGFCGCCNPIALATLPDGHIVTCEKGLPRVKVYTSDGIFKSVVAGAESFAENAKACEGGECLHGGLDAAVDSRGRVYILDLVTEDIRVMAKKDSAPAKGS